MAVQRFLLPLHHLFLPLHHLTLPLHHRVKRMYQSLMLVTLLLQTFYRSLKTLDCRLDGREVFIMLGQSPVDLAKPDDHIRFDCLELLS